jgi:LPS sulfotransferase NodH
VPCLEVSYEDLVADPGSVRSILEFLSVENPDVPLTSNMQKLNPKNHRELIANYDEVARVLEPTQFRDLLR